MSSTSILDRRPSRLRWGRRRHAGPLLLAAFALVAFGMPVAMVVLGAFHDAAPGAPGQWTAATLTHVVSAPATYRALGNTVLLALTSVPLGVGAAIVLCWLATRSDALLRSAVTPAMVLIFVMPPFFYGLSWVLLGQAPSGLLDTLVQRATGTQAAPVDLVSWPGLVLVLSLKIASISYLLLVGPFGSLDATLSEAARTSGSSQFGAVARIELPLLAPAIWSAVALGGVIAFGSLDIPLLFGRTAGIPVLATEIYDAINVSQPADYASANSVALYIIVAVAVLLLGQQTALRGRQFTTLAGKAHRRQRVELGVGRWWAGLLIALFLLVGLVLPLLQLLLASFQPYVGVYTNLTWSNYVAVLTSNDLLATSLRTLWVGLSAGLLSTLVAVTINLVAKRSRSTVGRLPQLLSSALLAVPGITVGVGLLGLVLSVPGVEVFYGTEWLNVAGLALVMTPIAARMTVGAIAQVSVELEEAAQVCGASQLRAVAEILVRLILPTFVATWFVTAIIAAGNLEIPALLSSPGSETVPVSALQLFQQGYLAQAAALFGVMLLVVVAPVALWGVVRGVQARRSQRTTGLAAPLAPTPPALGPGPDEPSEVDPIAALGPTKEMARG